MIEVYRDTSALSEGAPLYHPPHDKKAYSAALREAREIFPNHTLSIVLYTWTARTAAHQRLKLRVQRGVLMFQISGTSFELLHCKRVQFHSNKFRRMGEFQRLVESAEGQRAEALRTAMRRAFGSLGQLRERWPARERDQRATT